MAIHLLPLLLAKVAGKLAAKKAVGHNGAKHALGKKMAKEAAKSAGRTAVQEVRDRNKKDKSKE